MACSHSATLCPFVGHEGAEIDCLLYLALGTARWILRLDSMPHSSGTREHVENLRATRTAPITSFGWKTTDIHSNRGSNRTSDSMRSRDNVSWRSASDRAPI